MERQLVQIVGEINEKAFQSPKGTQINNKPEIGGFWTSTLLENNESGWTKFAKAEEIISEEQSQNMNLYAIEISKKARILTINSKEDYLDAINKYGKNLPDIYSRLGTYNGRKIFDFEILSKQYDALQLTEQGLRENYYEFYGWDCESTVWFNLNQFKKITKLEKRNFYE